MTPAIRLVLIACTLAAPVAAQQVPPEEFYTDDGVCSVFELQSMPQPEGAPGRMLTLRPAPVFQTLGSNPIPTGTSIPPLTALTCHFEFGDKVLVSADGDTPYCGWIDGDEVLEGRREGNLGVIMAESAYCGTIEPLRISEFCARLEENGARTAECADPSVRDSVFDTKFIVDNTGLAGDASTAGLSPVEIPIYTLPEDTERSGTITIFNVLLVHDVALGPEGQLRYLLLTGDQPLGWVDAEAGQVWYSRLATFFKPGGDGEVLSDFPHSPFAEPIAGPPANLATVSARGPEFQRYPVLQDNRAMAEEDPDFLPNLRVAFIGAYCGEGLCSEIDEAPPPADFDRLNRTDVLFLIDGTKSMRPYFDIVSRAVNGLARDFVGDTSFQFGVAMYGDYLSPSATGPGDAMQFGHPVPLQPILRGDEFAGLGAVDLFISDALQDKPEAANAALLRAVTETRWRGDNPRWIIHIADHGDRAPPSERLLETLGEANIFYAPIPVRGEAVLPASDAFVRHSEAIRAAHVTESGAPLTLEVRRTYDASGQQDEVAEFEAIGKAMRGALSFGEQLRQEAIRRAYAQQTGERVETSDADSAFPAGYADVKRAGLEIFLKDFEDAIGVDDIAQRTIAAVGHVQTAPVGEAEEDWAYYASLPPPVLVDLSGAMNKACTGFGESDSGQYIADAALEMLSILTGDPIAEGEDFESYFADRSNVPLATRTLFRGDDIRNMIADILNPTREAQNAAHQREFCRSAALLGRMLAGNKLARPFEVDAEGNRGDLIWRRDSETYSFRNPVAYQWIYEDDFGRKAYFLPLDFLPRYRAVEG